MRGLRPCGLRGAAGGRSRRNWRKGVWRFRARGENALHFEVAGIHEGHEVLHDDVHAVLVEVAVVAEREEVELEAFALHHPLAGYVAYDNTREVGLAGFRAQ